MTSNRAVLNLYKRVGETPLECLKRFQVANPEYLNEKMTYAGRLDPLASGVLLVLVGDECKQKEKYLGLDKEYELDVLFGITTDTQDVLGAIHQNESRINADPSSKEIGISYYGAGSTRKDVETKPGLAAKPGLVGLVEKSEVEKNLAKFIGRFMQKYPAYSSKTVKGETLFSLARAGEIDSVENWPEKEVEIYDIKVLGWEKVESEELHFQIIEKIRPVSGDFRQEEILEKWADYFLKNAPTDYQVLKLKVICSSGAYMRSLAERIGIETGASALAFNISRTRLGEYVLGDSLN